MIDHDHHLIKEDGVHRPFRIIPVVTLFLTIFALAAIPITVIGVTESRQLGAQASSSPCTRLEEIRQQQLNTLERAALQLKSKAEQSFTGVNCD